MGFSRFCALLVARQANLDKKKKECALSSVVALWQKISVLPQDPAIKFLYLLNPGFRHAEPEHFHPLVAYIVEVHPGLSFLLDRPEFLERYIQTVVHRIFFNSNRWAFDASVHGEKSAKYLLTRESQEALVKKAERETETETEPEVWQVREASSRRSGG